MKTKLFGIVLVALMVVGSGPTVAADGYASVVVGTGDPAVDVPAVQAAVDQGGTVRLVGTFDFGDEGSVSILNDVEIHGAPATIKNGKQAFAVGFDASLPDGGDARHQEGFVGPVVAFKKLEFENALYSSIYVIATSGLAVENCTFRDGKYYDYWAPIGVGGHFSVYIHAGWAVFAPYTGEPSDVTGHVIIKNNRWEGNSRRDDEDGFIPWPGADPVPMNGILSPVMMIGGKDVDVTIKNNRSENAGWYHFAVVDIQGEDSTIEVKNNTVINDWDHVTYLAVLLMCDMHMWTADMYPGLSEIEPGSPEVSLVVEGNRARFRGDTRGYTAGLIVGTLNEATIKNNRFDIFTEGYGCGGSAIHLQGVRDSTVRDNRIVQNDVCESQWSLGIAVWAGYRSSDRNRIANNRITGAANYGIVVGDYEDIYDPSTENVFENNDLEHLDLVAFEQEIDGRIYTEAHVLFDALSARNVYFGKGGETVLDFGTDNEYQVGHGHGNGPTP